MMQKREDWIDYTKAIAIFCVVLLHAGVPNPYRETIYTFVIPLFFFLSGMFAAPNRHNSFYKHIKSRGLRILTPYFCFNILTYLFWLFIGRHFGLDNNTATSITTPLIGILTGQSEYLTHYVPLWFLASLFTVEVIYYLVYKTNKSTSAEIIILFTFIIIAFLNFKYNSYKLPWGIDIALSMIVFYRVGYLMKDILKTICLSTVKQLFIILIAFAVNMLAVHLNSEVNVHSNTFGNYLYFLIGAISGIIFSISFSKVIALKLQSINLLNFIGRNTLIILSLHLIALSFFKALLVYVLNIDYYYYEHTFVYSIIASIASILILIPIIKLINKYFTRLLGQKYLQ